MERVTITFRFLSEDEQAEITRLRRLLKYALRSCRMRCVSLKEERPQSRDKNAR